MKVAQVHYQIGDLARSIPMLVAAIALVLALSFRTVRGVLLPLSAVSVALIWTMGFEAWVGNELTLTTLLVPPMLVILGVAYSVHLVSEYYDVLREEGVERIPGAHCYEFFATAPVFAALAESEPGTFYLTDFLLRHFERLVIRGLGLDRHPELFPLYFGNYRKLVYLAQAPEPDSQEQARGIAVRMGLRFEFRQTGYGTLGTTLAAAVKRRDSPRGNEEVVAWLR
jgi:hypothetical protein